MIKKILIGLLVLLFILAIGIFGWLQLKKKSYSGNYKLEGLSNEVTVTFDAYGIPHIRAKSVEDAFRALGYVHASDRLFQMDLLRHVGGGSLSEIFGPDLIETDKTLRTLGMNEAAIRSATDFESTASPEQKAIVTAYLDGLNQYIDKGETPVEYEILGIEKAHFTLVDVYRILGYIGFGFTVELKNEPLFDYIARKYGFEYVLDLSPVTNQYDFKIPVRKHPDSVSATGIAQRLHKAQEQIPIPLFRGSNAWVIGPRKTKSGKVLFANDTHIKFAQPSVWYEAHIEVPGKLSLYGNYLAGVPLPIIGLTDHHAWGLTIFPIDAMDFYREKIEGDKVMYKNEWVDLVRTTDTIKVKDGDEVTFDIVKTPHGPLITDLKGMKGNTEQPVSFFWTANAFADKKLEAVYTLVFAKTMNEFKKGCAMIGFPGLNVMYGDVEGNIAWWGTGVQIKRPEHVVPFLMLNGWNGNDDPLGFYRFDENPSSVNPPSQYLVTANNQPDSTNGILFPGYYYTGIRARILSSAISAKDDWTVDDMKQLQLDDLSPVYPKNAKVIMAGIEPDDDFASKLKSILDNWDGSHNLSSKAPIVYYKLLYHVLQMTLEDEMGSENFKMYLSTPNFLRAVRPLLRNNWSGWWDNVNTEEKESRQDIFEAAFAQTVSELRSQMGENTDDWRWEQVVSVTHEHPLGKVSPLNNFFNVGPLAAPGGDEIPNKLPFALNPDGVYKIKSGPALRILIDFSDAKHSLNINPTGISGNPMDPHYDDQAEMFVQGKYRQQLMDEKEIEKQSTGRWVLTP